MFYEEAVRSPVSFLWVFMCPEDMYLYSDD